MFFYESFSSALAYTSQPYYEAMAMNPSVTYTPCDTSLRKQNGNIITFTLFEEEGSPSETDSPSETRNNSESGDKFDDDSIMPPLLSEEEMDAIYYGHESDHEPISIETLEDISDGSHSHSSVNRR